MVSLAVLQDSFTRYLPVMRRYARFAFQHLDADKREEAVSNTLALAWKHWHRLNERGRADEPGILKAVVWYAIRQTRAGRRIDSAGRLRDVLSLRSYGKVTFEPGTLEDFVDKNRNSVPDIVSFKIDVPVFFRTLSPRIRNIALDLTHMTTGEVAARHGVSPGLISQARRELECAYRRFHSE